MNRIQLRSFYGKTRDAGRGKCPREVARVLRERGYGGINGRVAAFAQNAGA